MLYTGIRAGSFTWSWMRPTSRGKVLFSWSLSLSIYLYIYIYLYLPTYLQGLEGMLTHLLPNLVVSHGVCWLMSQELMTLLEGHHPSSMPVGVRVLMHTLDLVYKQQASGRSVREIAERLKQDFAPEVGRVG